MEHIRIKFNKEILNSIFNTILKEKKINFIELAEKTQVNYNTLKRWRYGKHSMPYDYFKQLYRFCNIIKRYEKFGKEISIIKLNSLGGKKTISRLSKSQLKEKMEFVRSKRTFKRVIDVDLEDDYVLEFFGIMIGDGCLSEYYSQYDKTIRREICICGNSIKDAIYFKHYITDLMERIFGICPYIRFRKDSNTVNLITRNKALFYWLKNLGFPVGVKGQIKIPEKIMSLPLLKINNVVKGLLDTDGCISARKDEDYKYPYIMITSNSQPLRLQLKYILRKQGLPAYIHANNVVIRGNKNILKWFKLIGSSNNRIIKKYEEWIINKKILPGS